LVFEFFRERLIVERGETRDGVVREERERERLGSVKRVRLHRLKLTYLIFMNFFCLPLLVTAQFLLRSLLFAPSFLNYRLYSSNFLF
jgi:hypothetical protein